jgi:hypothetical protein
MTDQCRLGRINDVPVYGFLGLAKAALSFFFLPFSQLLADEQALPLLQTRAGEGGNGAKVCAIGSSDVHRSQASQHRWLALLLPFW